MQHRRHTAAVRWLPIGAALLPAVLLIGCAEGGRGSMGAGGRAGAIVVERAVAWGLQAAGALTVGLHLHNTSAAADTLVAASSPAGQAMLHGVREGRMEMLPWLEVPAGETIILGTGGPHLMLEGVSPEMWDSAAVDVTLRLRSAGDIVLRVPIMNFTDAMRGLRR